MSSADEVDPPLKSPREMVQLSLEDYHTYPHIPNVYSLWPNTTRELNEGGSAVERSYFEEEVVKKTICGVSPFSFWVLCAVSLALVIAGVIGGVVAAVKIDKSRDSTWYVIVAVLAVYKPETDALVKNVRSLGLHRGRTKYYVHAPDAFVHQSGQRQEIATLSLSPGPMICNTIWLCISRGILLYPYR